jgi:C-terminal processing protease CtpA/Prc
MILELIEGGAAETASLLPGDVLAGANGTSFRTLDDLEANIADAPNGLLRLDFYRAGSLVPRRVTVQLSAVEEVASAA